MAIVDNVTIKVKAGNGGHGSSVFVTVGGNNKSYPDGGNGGNGGSIYIKTSNNIRDLNEFRYKKEIRAEDGENGQRKSNDGKDAPDIILFVPIGTKIIEVDTKEEIELLKNNQEFLVARGGRGGEGSHDYKPTLRNYRPQRREGEGGEERTLHLTLTLIADVGLIGFPNAGKSSLLASLTNAHPKIGDYPFTTVEPNLGVLDHIILADIPGLIEGASRGRGLGTTFLKHIEKTKVLLHCIAATDEDIEKSYTTIRNEFAQYGKNINTKKEIILLTKVDLTSEKEQNEKIKLLSQYSNDVLPISIYDQKSIDLLKKHLQKFF